MVSSFVRQVVGRDEVMDVGDERLGHLRINADEA